MKKTPVVITTINPPNTVIEAYNRLQHPLIIIGDKKTPDLWNKWHDGNIKQYYSIENQKKEFSDFCSVLPVNHYARKNIGYLIAMKQATDIIESDDDNYPYDFYPNFEQNNYESQEVSSESKFVNIYKLFTEKETTIWARGFPLKEINKKPSYSFNTINKKYIIQQGLIDKDTDVDAIYRLTIDKHIVFKKTGAFALSPHNYAPINTQNTYWMKEAFILMYLPIYATFRSCDILKGWIAQRLSWELKSTVLFLPPSVYQERNPHDYLVDFESEIPLYLHTQRFIKILESTKLTGSIEAKMIQLYEALIAEELIDKRELDPLKKWVNAVNTILG
jgi:hypothetical protein